MSDLKQGVTTATAAAAAAYHELARKLHDGGDAPSARIVETVAVALDAAERALSAPPALGSAPASNTIKALLALSSPILLSYADYDALQDRIGLVSAEIANNEEMLQITLAAPLGSTATAASIDPESLNQALFAVVHLGTAVGLKEQDANKIALEGPPWRPTDHGDYRTRYFKGDPFVVGPENQEQAFQVISGNSYTQGEVGLFGDGEARGGARRTGRVGDDPDNNYR